MANLYERLGGEAAVDAAVDLFYEKMLTDARVKHFFINTDMDKQRDHQKRFLTFAFGGPNQYNGQAMRVAHTKLVQEQGLNDSHFDAVLENLGAALAELGVNDDLIDEVALVAETVRDEVLNR
jgi:hemoglobin